MSFSTALTAIHRDGVICYPTEGVWGLGCHPQSLPAFSRLLTVKQRPAEKGVILLAADLDQLAPYIVINDEITALFRAHQHEFITFILPKSPDCPDFLSGQFDSIAVRVTHYQPLRDLCYQAQTALVSTSANLSGQPPVESLAQAKSVFGRTVDAYVDMPLGGKNKPSRIVQWRKGTLTVIRD